MQLDNIFDKTIPHYSGRSGLIKILLLCATGYIMQGCNKLVQIPQPINTITAAKTFSSEADATSAITAIYSDMSVGGSANPFGLAYANGATTICGGLSADELNVFAYPFSEFKSNGILSTDGIIKNSFWVPAYYNIYQANAVIENLQNSSQISDSVKKELTGEAKFIRAFCHFYLVNLFGDVPLITQTNWFNINTLVRTPSAQVYQQILTDLRDAQQLLPGNYTVAGGERIRANSWAATALLARVYLYRGNWAGADSAASAVINSGNYSLLSGPNLGNVFLANSGEAILQLQTVSAWDYATVEGNALLPPSQTTSPVYDITDQLLSAFEPNDLRRQNWVDSTIFQGTVYYYPAKYKVWKASPNNITEYYTVLRFAEQYLIRAEARALEQTNNLPGAISDLNVIRERAGLPDLDPLLNQAQVLAAVLQERRIELFSEWGHRWLDLKRLGLADQVLAPLKTGWTHNDQLWPVPTTELTRDPNLTQNPGYF